MIVPEIIPQIEVTPSSYLPISLNRQQQIIDAINAKLRNKPRQGFCFMGRPGVGKTYLMKAIQRAIVKAQTNRTHPGSAAVVKLFTLADWQNARVRQVRGESASLAETVSSERIREIAAKNESMSRCFGINPIHAFDSLHLFIDEFDSQPTVSDFSSSGLQSLVNSIYENAARLVSGNDQDCCQLIVAMNKTWCEFENAYGIHVARRIAEMCVRIDFDRETDCVIDAQPENANLMHDPLEVLFA